MKIDNFFLNSFGFFKGCKRPKRKPDYVSFDREGRISSEYWYSEKGVIRCSNHWSSIYSKSVGIKAYTCGNIASCYWILVNKSPKQGYDATPCGFCSWDAFDINRG